MIGRRLGSYRIEREIGRGGMGAVYEASRADNEFNKRAAIKLVKRGMDTDFILRRFRKERQILAALDHPHIAGLLDGGTTEDGLPYFVMEFIEGQPLYSYCDNNKLNITERLKLFRSICDAVHYAHQKQVVHRDIKPSNVLVTSAGIPKLLDFGIAKLLNPQLAGDITHDPTATAMRLMTPEYVAGTSTGRADHATTDVYSLGVLLYELLTGHRPYRLVNRAPHEIARVICEEARRRRVSSSLAPKIFCRVSIRQATTPQHSNSFTSREAERSSNPPRARRRSRQHRHAGAAQGTGMAIPDRRRPARRHHALSRRPSDQRSARPAAREHDRSAELSNENSLAVLPMKLMDINQPESNPDYLGTGLADA